MTKVLWLLFHPRLENSRINSNIKKAMDNQTGILIKDMYEIYPDFNVNVKTEQEQLLEADLVVIQHPMYWYAAPPLYKQWIDLVLEYGWAYGKNGDKLKNKYIFHVVSSGGSYDSYGQEGKNHYTYHELMRPFELTYLLCQMNYLPPYIIPGANKIEKEILHDHLIRIQKLIQTMSNTDFPEIKTQELNYLNDLKLL